MDEELKPLELSRTLTVWIRVLRATPMGDETPAELIIPET